MSNKQGYEVRAIILLIASLVGCSAEFGTEVHVRGPGGMTCSGALLSSHAVLTAAHCAVDGLTVAGIAVREFETHPSEDVAILSASGRRIRSERSACACCCRYARCRAPASSALPTRLTSRASTVSVADARNSGVLPPR